MRELFFTKKYGRIKAKSNLVSGFTPTPFFRKGVSSQSERGFTLMEIVIGVAVVVIISSIALTVLRSFDENQALSKERSNAVSLLEKARQLTLFSKDAFQYGVHFDTEEIVLFKGTSYSASDPENSLTRLHSKVLISGINLTGGGSDVVFKRLSGETSEDGTITLQNKLDSSKTEIITISKTGLVK